MELKEIIGQIVEDNTSRTAWSWMENKTGSLNMTFAAIPRQTGKEIITLKEPAPPARWILVTGAHISWSN